MGRAYAGILGPLALALIVLRGLKEQAGVETTLAAALGGLVLFAGLGYLVGWLAEHLVEEAVRTQFTAAMEAWRASSTGDAQAPARG
jgi:hypothetical protein